MPYIPWGAKPKTPAVVTPTPAAPAAAAPPAPAPAPAAPTPPPASTPGADSSSLDWARYYLNPSSYAPGAQFFHDVANPQPMTPGPQSWRDWATKEYRPSPADIGTVYGDAWSYGLSPLAVQGGNAAGNAAGAGPTGIDPDQMRQRIRTAEENVGPQGPFLTAAGYATQPLTYVGGRYILGPLGKAVEGIEAIPKAIRPLVSRAVQGGTQSSILSGAKTAGQGGDPVDIFKSAAEAFPVGAAISAAVPSSKGRTQEDIEAQTARAKQAADEQLNKLRYPVKQVGYDFGKQEPTLSDLINQRDWALEQGKASPLMRLRAASATANDVAGSTTPNQAGWSPEKGWSSPPSDYGVVTQGKADPGKVLQSIAQKTQRTIEEGTPIGGTPGQGGVLEDAAQKAARQASNAAMLRKWSSEAGLPGVDVRRQAVEEMQKYPVGSDEYNALKSIAGVEPKEGGGWLGNTVKKVLPTVLTLGGELASTKAGIPGGATSGSMLSQILTGGVERATKPPSLSPLIQQEIRRQSAPLTGTATSPGYGNALGNLLIWAAQGGPR